LLTFFLTTFFVERETQTVLIFHSHLFKIQVQVSQVTLTIPEIAISCLSKVSTNPHHCGFVHQVQDSFSPKLSDFNLIYVY
jgi:hypothetical protein